ncbi:MAG: DUF2294 domain-containing protein [Deltaproteobacteria bacterium]|nr:DUF2294 domain-containing protein [Deltaproteobacteria bacterium]
MPQRALGQIEDEIGKAFVAFEKEYMGRGPKDVSCKVLGDMILVRLTGVLTPAERHLAKTAEGIDLVKKMRTSLLEGAKDLVYTVIGDVAGRGVVSMHTDVSTRTGERVFVFTLEAPPEGGRRS